MSKLRIQAALCLLLAGCSTMGVNNTSCPPAKTDGNGMLILKSGETLKCQVRRYTGNMGCDERFTNTAGDDGLACTNGTERGVIFFFDEHSVLKSYEFTHK